MEKKKVIIADDDADLVHMLTLRLEKLGFQVLPAPDAMHALTDVHHRRPDLVILDVNMPSGSGLAVCEMLASDKKLAGLPVIVMTGQTDTELQQRCRGLGAHYLAKGSGLWERLRLLVTQLVDVSPTAPQEPPAAAAEPTPKRENRPPRILCIDDDPAISKILKLRLEQYGVDVVRAFSGMQGYWTALETHPDVIITDLSMPDGEGNYVFMRLKNHPLTENTPVFVLSGQDNPAVKRTLTALGVDAFLGKPLVLDNLLHHLRRHIKLKNDEHAQTLSPGPSIARSTP